MRPPYLLGLSNGQMVLCKSIIEQAAGEVTVEQGYGASAVSRPFWFVEFKKVMILLHQGLSYSDIRTKTLEDNLFDVSKEYRAKEMFNATSRRAKVLDAEGIALFCRSDLAGMKLLELVAILQTDRLLGEFIHEVYSEKVRVGDLELRDADFNSFFKRKQDQDEGMAAWKDYTLKKLRNSYVNYLCESGLLSREGDVRRITPPLMSEELKTYLRCHGMGYHIADFEGVR